jgi:hypothetical protein
MTKKRLALIAVLPLAIAVTFGVLAMLPPRPRVTKANFDRVEKGMTVAEVEGIFGQSGELLIIEGDPREEGKIWWADDGSWARVGIDEGRVTEKKHWNDSGEKFLDKIRRWLLLR